MKQPPEVRAAIMRRFRSRRAEEMTGRFPSLREMRVIDLGGSESFWTMLPHNRIPSDLTIVNLRPVNFRNLQAQQLVGDACEAPSLFEEGGFDLVVSNSVLEHVGGHHRRKQFAESVRWLAPRHWVQTPSLYSPMEPR